MFTKAVDTERGYARMWLDDPYPPVLRTVFQTAPSGPLPDEVGFFVGDRFHWSPDLYAGELEADPWACQSLAESAEEHQPLPLDGETVFEVLRERISPSGYWLPYCQGQAKADWYRELEV